MDKTIYRFVDSDGITHECSGDDIVEYIKNSAKIVGVKLIGNIIHVSRFVEITLIRVVSTTII